MVVSRVGAVRPLETVAPLRGTVLNDVRLSCFDSEASDDDELSVGAVRPLETVAPLSGAVLNDARQPCSDSEASDDDVLLVGALVPMNRPAVCCARLDDFNWVVPDYVPDTLLSGWDIEVGVTDLTQDIHVLPDVFPVVSAGAATVPMPLQAVAESVPQVVIGREAASPVVTFAEEMTLRVAMVGLIDDGSDRPAELLDSEPDCCFMDVVLVPERSPVVSARGAVVPTSLPTSLPTITEVFSSAVLAGGSLLRPPGRGRDSHGSGVCPAGRWKRTSSGF